MNYEAKTFNLPENITGLSQKQIDVHLALYKGYVTHVNLLLEQLEKLESENDLSYAKMEVRRRLGFEFNGMRLHEYYFEQLEDGAKEMPEKLKSFLQEHFGGSEKFFEKIKEVALTRGIGWTILHKDPKTGRYLISWVSDHELGMLSGTEIIFALDMWEHAFMVDYTPAEKGDYVNAYLKAVNWEVVANRL